MTAYPAWTPASRPGIIPLHPLTLRHDPRPLVRRPAPEPARAARLRPRACRPLAYLVVLLGDRRRSRSRRSRASTRSQPGTEEFDTVMAGSIAITAIAGIVLGLAAGALGVIVQGIVVSEVAHAAVAEKLTLGGLWQRVKPVAWRLHRLLVPARRSPCSSASPSSRSASSAIGVAAPPAAIGLTILLVLAAIPLVLVAVDEAAARARRRSSSSTRRIGAGDRPLVDAHPRPLLGRARRHPRHLDHLQRGRRRSISIPFTFLSTGLTTIIAPTGDPEPSGDHRHPRRRSLLTQVVTLLIQSVAVVVQSTATALVYIDCRMRHEGLDLDLLTYVERRDAGATGLAGPLPRAHRPRDRAPRYAPAYPQAGYPQPATRRRTPRLPAAGVPAARLPAAAATRSRATRSRRSRTRSRYPPPPAPPPHRRRRPAPPGRRRAARRRRRRRATRRPRPAGPRPARRPTSATESRRGR